LDFRKADDDTNEKGRKMKEINKNRDEKPRFLEKVFRL